MKDRRAEGFSALTAIRAGTARCGGNPTIKGTRISAFMLANMLRGPEPMDPFTIIENYDSLTYADISNVRGWMTRWINQ